MYLPSCLYILPRFCRQITLWFVSIFLQSQYIYQSHHLMCFYIIVPYDSSLSSLSVKYSTFLMIVSSCLYILLRFVDTADYHIFVIIWYVQGVFPSSFFIFDKNIQKVITLPLGYLSGLICFYCHGWSLHICHYRLNQCDHRLSFLLIWQKKQSKITYIDMGTKNDGYNISLNIYTQSKTCTRMINHPGEGEGPIHIKLIILDPNYGTSLYKFSSL